MSICVKLITGVSLFIFVFAAWIGFTDICDTSDPMNRVNAWVKKHILKWKCFQRRYAVTKMGLIIGFCLGVLSIVLS